MPIKAVIIDYDGAIVARDFTSDCYEEFNTLKFLRGISNFMVKAYIEGKLPRPLEAIAYLLLLYGLRGAKADEIESYVERKTPEHLVPGVAELIREVKERGIKVGIVSENIQFQPKYAAKLLDVDFVCSNEVEVKEGKITGKISRFSRKNEMINEIAEYYSIKPEEIIYFGDDVDPFGKVKCALFNPKRRSDERKVDGKNCFLIQKPSEFLLLVEKLCQA